MAGFKIADYGGGPEALYEGIQTGIQAYYDARSMSQKEKELEAKANARDRKSRFDDANALQEGKKYALELIEKGYSPEYIETAPELAPARELQAQYAQKQGLTAPKGFLAQQKTQGFLPQKTPQAMQKEQAESQLEARKNQLALQKLEEDVASARRAGPDKLRKEWKKSQTTQDTEKLLSSLQKIKKSAESPSAAGDLALVFNYMKMLDPGSVVRESEFQSAAEARGYFSELEQSGVPIPGFVKQALQKAKDGQFLLPEQRRDFFNKSKQLYDGQLKIQNKWNNTYKNLAEQQGLDWRQVVRPELFDLSVDINSEFGGTSAPPEYLKRNYEKFDPANAPIEEVEKFLKDAGEL